MTPDRHRIPTVSGMGKPSLISDENSAELGMIQGIEQALRSPTNCLFDVTGTGSSDDRASYHPIKRVLDVCLSLFLLVLLLPLIALIAIANWVEADGPLLYVSKPSVITQKRP
jgi:hypothetical protein